MMTRADFWCRVLGWVQIVVGLAVAILVFTLWSLLNEVFHIGEVSVAVFFKWLAILVFALPPFLSGVFTVFFANKVEQARQGHRGQAHLPLRSLMVLAGLWSAGVVGLAGFSLPPVSLFAILALATVVFGIGGAGWTADLLGKQENQV